MVAISFVSDWNLDCCRMLTLLYDIIRADAIAYLYDCKRCDLDHIFWLAKTAQYSAILILGKAGIERLKKYLSPRRTI